METPKRRGSYKKYIRNSPDCTVAPIPKSTESYYKKLRASEDEARIPYASFNYVSDGNNFSDGTFLAPDNEIATHRLVEPCQISNDANIVADQDNIGQNEQNYCHSDDEFLLLDESDNQPMPDEEALFPGCRLSKTEAVILIFAFAIKTKLPNSGIQDLLNLINIILPPGTSVPQSLYLLEKILGADYSSAVRHYYCDQCATILENGVKNCLRCVSRPCQTCETNLLGDCTVCRTCGVANKKLADGKFFVTFDIETSLRHVLRRPAVQHSILKNFIKRKSPSENLRDIIDGEQYQLLKLEGHDISCCVNTDDVTLFNSSTASLWPLLFSINELDYSLRRKHTILGGLWWGTGKPNFDIFLKPVVDVVEKLSVRKVRWDFLPSPIPSKVLFPIFATDAVAKCKFQGMTQFNGEFGCPWCLIRGEALRDESNNFKKWIYDPRLLEDRRTDEGYRQHVRHLCESLQKGRMIKESVYGVTNASQLLLFPNLDIVNGNVFDYMHSGLLGVLKTLTMAFFESSNHHKPYYLGRFKSDINKRIALCKFPSECSRIVRTLDQLNLWKASEWKLWMTLSNCVLTGFLRATYLKHLASLTNFLSFLLQDEVTPEDIRSSNDLVNSFCNLIPALYGNDYFLFNVHILRHAVDCVIGWGPLWGYSLFQFESYNDVLGNSYSGTRKVGEQIVHRTIRSQEVYSQSESIFRNDFSKSLCDSLIDRKKLFVKFKKLNDCTLVGTRKPYHFSEEEKKLLKSASIPCESKAYSYNSFFSGKKIFKTKGKSAEGGSDFITMSGDKFYEIENIVSINSYLFGVLFVRRIYLTPDNYGLSKFKFKVNSNMTPRLKILQPKDLGRCKVTCITREDGRLLGICPLVNSVELE